VFIQGLQAARRALDKLDKQELITSWNELTGEKK
jgi:hypothetical protein